MVIIYSGIIGPGGRIKGCFDEIFDGITVWIYYLDKYGNYWYSIISNFPIGERFATRISSQWRLWKCIRVCWKWTQGTNFPNISYICSGWITLSTRSYHWKVRHLHTALTFSSTWQLLIIYSRYLDITKSFYKELVTVYR